MKVPKTPKVNKFLPRTFRIASSVDLNILYDTFCKMFGKTRYSISRVVDLDAPPDKVLRITQYGFVQYILYRATRGHLKLPPRPALQVQWCDDILKLPRVNSQSDLQQQAEDPTRLFLCIIPGMALKYGTQMHPYLAHSSRTIECYGGQGVGSRPLDHPLVLPYTAIAFELPVKRISPEKAALLSSTILKLVGAPEQITSCCSQAQDQLASATLLYHQK
jgi:hypothetical protein